MINTSDRSIAETNTSYSIHYRDATRISGVLIQACYRYQAQKLVSNLGNLCRSRVLDLGCGTGFLKPLFVMRGAEYHCTQLVRPDGFTKGFFPDDLKSTHFDLIVSLSCVDEMPDQANALAVIADRLKHRGRALIAVRNASFPIYGLKRILYRFGLRRTLVVDDLEYDQWIELIEQAGFKIDVVKAYQRPWLIGYNINGVKNILYRLLNGILPTRKCYMLQFVLSKRQ